MAVYFVYRCDEMGPSDLYRRRFDDATLLDWFRRHWRPIAGVESASRYAERVLGVDTWQFGRLFDVIHVDEFPLPATIRGVRDVIGAFYHGEIRWEDHCLQMLDSFEGTEVVYHFFDDDFVRQRPDLTAYLLHDGPLPDGAGEPGWTPADGAVMQYPTVLSHEPGEGRLFVIPLIRDGSLLYEELEDTNNVDVVEGLRLPDLCRALMNLPAHEADEEGGYKYLELQGRLFDDDLTEDAHERAFVQALQAEPDDEATWRAYADWLMERGQPGPGVRLLRLALPRMKGLDEGWGEPRRNVAHVGEHVAQVSICVGHNEFDQLIFFDDLWASAHPLLANALIRYGSRWDVLSTGDEQYE